MPNDRRVSIVGVPLEYGQPLAGVSKAPYEFRVDGLVPSVEAQNWKCFDCGDIPIPDACDRKLDQAHGEKKDGQPFLKCASVVSKVNKATADVVYDRAEKGDFVVTIGGDHSVAIGSIAGILRHRPDTGIVWVDAHADINTPLTTFSGNIHGMVLSFLMKHPDCASVEEYAWLKDVPKLDPTKLVYIGLRDLDVGEKRIIRESGIKAFTMHDVDKHGIGRVMEMAIEHLRGRKDCPLHLSFDIDGVDPLFAPSTGTRVGGGLTQREAYFICESVAETGLLASMDIVEVNTSLGDKEGASNTVHLAEKLVVAALGDSIL